MEGDNQFFCTLCQKKTDAQRQMKLVSTPPYLCLSLQRFVFDMKVGFCWHLHTVIYWTLKACCTPLLVAYYQGNPKVLLRPCRKWQR